MKQLAIETDKLNSTIQIVYVDSLSDMPKLYSFYLRENANLIDNGHAYPIITHNDTDHAIVALQDDNILGFILFNYGGPANLAKLGWIVMSAVDERYRSRGIFTILNKHFEDLCKNNGCNTISSLVHKNNKVRLASAAKVGLKPTFKYLMKRLH